MSKKHRVSSLVGTTFCVATLVAVGLAPVSVVPCTLPLGPGAAPECNINARCIGAMPETRAVVQIIAPDPSEGSKLGSGVLVNTGLAGQAGVPYVLTAAHLVDYDDNGDVDAAEASFFENQVVAAFGLESPCEGGDVATPYLVEGASILDINEALDLVLLRLDVDAEALASSTDAYYAGREFLSMEPPLHVHAIHHPCADIKMVSGAETPTLESGYYQTAGLACGGIAPGSSGGPLFNTATRSVIGVVSGTLAGDSGIFPQGEVCAGEMTPVVFGPIDDFGFQFLGAQDSVPPFEPS